MARTIFRTFLSLMLFAAVSFAANKQALETDTIATANGDLEITFIGHGSLYFSFAGKIIHVDPVSSEADYSKLPKADIILVTHEHKDHLDPAAIALLRKDETILVLNPASAKEMKDAVVMKNGDVKTIEGLKIEAVPAYNIVHMRSESVPYHPKGNGNGYVITFGDKRVYVAGDTENIPEMKYLERIDIAFLPMNLPYTMTPQMVADAAGSFMPEILYPYHYGETDVLELVDLLKNSEIEVRVRSMK
jgi:L-ascorbate metabolism protein UlaG (beta-lactamase superfamily)